MIINRENYQIWITDYYDGQLDQLQEKILLDFLERNPDLKSEFDDFSNFYLTAGKILFDLKKDLLRSPDELTEQQTDNYLIALVENDLSPDQADEIINLTKDRPELRNNLEIYRRIKLSPPDIIYPWKGKLRKISQAGKRTRIIIGSLSAAASIAIILSITLFMNKSSVNTEPPIQLASADTTVSQIIQKTTAEEETVVTESKDPIIETIATVETIIIIPVADSDEEAIEETLREDISITPPAHIGQIRINVSEKNYLLAEAGPYPELPFDFTESISIREFLAQQFRKYILQHEDPGTDILKIYEIADAGIKGMNILLGWEMEIETQESMNGSLDNIKFSSQLVNIDHSPKRNH